MLQHIINHLYQIFINIALRALDGVDWVCKKYAIQASPSPPEPLNLVGSISCGSNGHIETYPTEETPPSNKEKRVKLILDLSVSPTKEVSILSATKFEVDLQESDHQPLFSRKFVEPAFSALEKLSATMRPCLEKTLNEIEDQIKPKSPKGSDSDNPENSAGKGEIESNRIILSPKKRLSSSNEIDTDNVPIAEQSTSTKPRASISALALELPAESQIEALNKSIEMERKEKSNETRKRKNVSTSSSSSEEDIEDKNEPESSKDISESLKSLLLSEEDYESAEDPDYQLEEQSSSSESEGSSEDSEATKLEVEQTVIESLSMNTDASESNSYQKLQNEMDGDKSGDFEIIEIIKTVKPTITMPNRCSDMEISNEESPEVKFIGTHTPNPISNQDPIKKETNCAKEKSPHKEPDSPFSVISEPSSSPKANANDVQNTED